MTYGGSIALIVIGAILRFAISYSPANVNLQLVGLILMIAGAIGLVISLVWMFGRRRQTVTTTRTPSTTEVYEERRYNEPPV
jgi:disulfide bond formation protein DsbB